MQIFDGFELTNTPPPRRSSLSTASWSNSPNHTSLQFINFLFSSSYEWDVSWMRGMYGWNFLEQTKVLAPTPELCDLQSGLFLGSEKYNELDFSEVRIIFFQEPLVIAWLLQLTHCCSSRGCKFSTSRVRELNFGCHHLEKLAWSFMCDMSGWHNLTIFLLSKFRPKMTKFPL